jgi:hypothetical protein
MCGGLIGREVIVTRMNGMSDVGDLFNITTDRVDLLQEGAVDHLSIPLDSIQSIIKMGSTSGSLFGFLGGGLLGGFLGGAIASASTPEPKGIGEALVYPLEQAPAMAGGFLIGFGVGGALGAVIGMGITDHEIYTFNRYYGLYRSDPVRDTLRLSPKEIIQETATTITIQSGKMELTLSKLSVQIIREPERITIIGPRKLLRAGGA